MIVDELDESDILLTDSTKEPNIWALTNGHARNPKISWYFTRYCFPLLLDAINGFLIIIKKKSEDHKVKLIAMQSKGRASTWWDEIRWHKKGKGSQRWGLGRRFLFHTSSKWEKKSFMNKAFLPIDYFSSQIPNFSIHNTSEKETTVWFLSMQSKCPHKNEVGWRI